MVANLLYALGADFGDESQLLEADKWNPRGYFELREVFILNDSVLLGDYAPSRQFWTTRPEDRSVSLRLIMTFARMRYLLTLWNTNLIASRAAKKTEAIRAMAARYDDLVIKDPRLSLMIRHWSPLSNVHAILYCYRHPYEVALSLKKRGKIPMWLGYKLWEFHVREFLKGAVGLPLVVVNYNRLFIDSRHEEFKRLYTFLDKPYREEEAQAILASVMDVRLKNNIYRSEALPASVTALYALLNTYHTDYFEPKPFASTPGASSITTPLAEAYPSSELAEAIQDGSTQIH
jgi:hypothetical protein